MTMFQTQRPTQYREPEPTAAPADLLDKGELARLLSIERQIEGCSDLVKKGAKTLRESVTIARALEQLRTLFDDEVMDTIHGLMGSPLGFRTDRDRDPKRGPYTKDEIREVCIEALIRGVHLTGNEFNVIGGRCYVTREGFSRLLHDLDGLQNLEIVPEVPQVKPGGCVVVSRASWIYGGLQHTLERALPIRLNEGQGADAALGKADRKMKAAIYARITGSAWVADGEVEDGEGTDGLGTTTRAVDRVKTIETSTRAQLSKAFGAGSPETDTPGTPPPTAPAQSERSARRGWSETPPASSQEPPEPARTAPTHSRPDDPTDPLAGSTPLTEPLPGRQAVPATAAAPTAPPAPRRNGVRRVLSVPYRAQGGASTVDITVGSKGP